MADRRQSFWDDTLINSNITSGTEAIIVLSLTPGLLSEGFTLTRTIARFTLYAAAVPAVSSGQQVDLGIGLATKEGIAASAVPTANSQTEKPMGDWVWRTREVVVRDTSEMMEPRSFGTDIRAGRKLAGGQMYLIITNDPVFGTAFAVRLSGVVRLLILRP